MDADACRMLKLLREPGREHRPVIFLILNGHLTATGLRAQIAQLHERGFGAVLLHPMGESFRLADFISGIDPPYLSDEYFALIRVAVEEAERLGILVWLYDEGGWPSGTAQGRVVEGHPELRGWTLMVDGVGETVAEIEAGGRRLRFTAEVGPYPVDTLNPATTERFIAVTHERYAEAVGEFFGRTIPGIFTDEPSVGGEVGTARIPWTPRMLDEFERRRGYDLRPWLPALFSPETLGFAPDELFALEQVAAVRCEFAEVWTDLFAEAYFAPLNRWCAEHGLVHTGHVGGEDELPVHARAFGHFFKTAGSLHAPGVDAIWRQIFPGQDNFGFPRFAASALAQRPQADEPGPWTGMTITESYAVYGPSLTPDQMRWVADYQFVRGINYLGAMCVHYETRGGHWIAAMGHLGAGNPLFDCLSSLTDHAATISAAVRASRPVTAVAVYYPIEAAWRGGETGAAAWRSLREVCAALEGRQVSFDLIDAHTLAAARVSDGLLETPGQIYGTVIVPETTIMPAAALSALAGLRENGGRVAFCGDLPAMPAELHGAEEFASARARLAEVAVRMDGAHARDTMGGDDPRGLGPSLTFLLDGFTAAYLGPGRLPIFTDREVANDACLLVPQEEIGRLAELLNLVLGRHELHLDDPEPDLAMDSRVAGDLNVHLLHNQAEREITPSLLLVSDEPRIVETWDTLGGEPRVLAVHRNVSETTRFDLPLVPGASALLTTRPLQGDAPEVPRPRSLTSIGREVRAQRLEIVRESVITEAGDLEVREHTYTPPQVPADFHLRPLEELGLTEFAGTVRYRLDLYVRPGEINAPLFLDLGEVGCVARAWLNGEELGESAWPPHRVEITGIAEPGNNELVVEVTTTLANQVARPEVVALVRERGWFNPYYERVLPWLNEPRRSGLIGPIEVLRG